MVRGNILERLVSVKYRRAVKCVNYWRQFQIRFLLFDKQAPRVFGLVLIGVFACGGCMRGPSGESIPTHNARLDSLLAAVPVISVSLDDRSTDWLRPVRVNGEEGGLELGRPFGITHRGDSLIVADEANHTLTVFATEGPVRETRRIGMRGQGPGEFEGPIRVRATDRYTYVHEPARGVHVFDDRLAFVNTMPIVSGRGNIAATGSRLFAPAREHSSHVLEVLTAGPGTTSVGSLLPVIIPLDMQPRGFNSFVADACVENGMVVVGYRGLPYLFLHDPGLRHTATIKLTGTAIEEIENPAPIPFRTSEPQFVRHVLALLQIHRGHLFVGIRNALYVIRIEDRMLIRAWRLGRPEDDPRADVPVHLGDISVSGDDLFLVTPFEAFVFHYRTDL